MGFLVLGDRADERRLGEDILYGRQLMGNIWDSKEIYISVIIAAAIRGILALCLSRFTNDFVKDGTSRSQYLFPAVLLKVRNRKSRNRPTAGPSHCEREKKGKTFLPPTPPALNSTTPRSENKNHRSSEASFVWASRVPCTLKRERCAMRD